MASTVARGIRVPRTSARLEPLSPDDAPLLAEAYWRSYREQSPDFSIAHATEDVARLLSNEHGELVREASLIALSDGRIVGAVITALDPPYRETPAGPYVVDLYVVPSERRQGLGSALLLRALAAVEGQRVHLRVDDDNGRAVRLYERNGFAPVTSAPPDPSS